VDSAFLDGLTASSFGYLDPLDFCLFNALEGTVQRVTKQQRTPIRLGDSQFFTSNPHREFTRSALGPATTPKLLPRFPLGWYVLPDPAT